MNLDLEPLRVFADYGWPGVVVGALLILFIVLIKRGIRLKIEAEIPPKREANG